MHICFHTTIMQCVRTTLIFEGGVRSVQVWFCAKLAKFCLAAVQIMAMSASLFPTPPVIVKCEHPFSYRLVYKRKIDLFGGRIANPSV
jgi:hypothetical protein